MLRAQVLDIEKIRTDFPILKRKINGRRLVYLDNAATTQKPRAVIDTLVDYYSRYNSNVHRSVHTLSEEATEQYERARKVISNFIKASPNEVVFTRGTTESINLVRFAYAENELKRGDLIITTLMEHHSNIVPWQLVAKKKGAKLSYVGLNKDGTLNIEELEQLLRESPSILAITHCSNVLGTINDIEKICKLAKSAGAIVIVDGAQSVPHMPIDVNRINCDFFAFSGHKMLGPTGIGVLYGKKRLLEDMEPFHGGGEMIKEVHLDHSTWNEVPYKFEAGTTNIADAIGLMAAIEYLNSIGMDKVRKHEIELVKYSLDVLSKLDGIDIYGPLDAEKRGGLISFNINGVHPHDVATILDEQGIAIRSGHHCAQPLIRWLDVPATCRASFYIYNSYDDIDALKLGLEKVKEVFK